MLQDLYKRAAEQMQALSETKFNSGTMDVWGCTTHDFGSAARRSCFIGSGLIGIRVPAEGEPSVYPTFSGTKMAAGGTLMHGVWSEGKLIDVFNFMGLSLSHSRSTFRRDSGTMLDYTQHLNWRTGVVTTCCKWVCRGGIFDVKYRIWLFRNLKNAGCVELDVTPLQDSSFSIADCIEGDFIPRHGKMQYQVRYPSEFVKTVYTDIEGINMRLAASSYLTLDGEPIAGTMELTPGGFKRTVFMPVKKDRTYRFRKTAALFSSENCSDPVHASASLASGIADNFDRSWQNHLAAWEKLWQSRIEVSHNGVQALVNNALYQIYSNLAEDVDWPHGPCGLSSKAYCNRIFHDCDVWTYPVMLLFNPELAKSYVNYRYKTLPGARRNALANSMDGIQIAWESAETGDEVVSGLVYSHQRHINSDVALAVWQYYMATQDKDFLRSKGAAIICGSADFWVSRSIYNKDFDRYEILHVCCVDEAAFDANNNALTNYSAKVNLELAAQCCKILDLPANPKWAEVAQKMYIPIDEKLNIILEHDRYNGELINQADATLTVYPWEMPMSDELKRNTVEYYRKHYRPHKIMMGSAIDGIVDCELGNQESSWAMMLDLLPYHRGDFLLVSESPLNETISMLTGLGGLLQLIMMGWGGIRMHEDALICKNNLPPQIEYMKIYNLHYQNKTFDLVYRNNKVERCDK